jgi:urease accessory protein
MGNAVEKFLLHQLADSAFPTGGFAHSGGLEAAWQMGYVATGATFEAYLETQIRQAVLGAVPFVMETYLDKEKLGEVDLVCEAFLSNHVARRASAGQGQAFAMACSKAFGVEDAGEILKRIRKRQIVGHLAPVFGAIVAGLGVERDSTIRLFLFVTIRGWVSAAVRLGIVGPLEAQRVQWEAVRKAESLVGECGQRTIESAAQSAPLFDLLQGSQDRLYTRLFQS